MKCTADGTRKQNGKVAGDSWCEDKRRMQNERAMRTEASGERESESACAARAAVKGP